MAYILKRYSDNGRTNLISKTINTGKNDKLKNNHFISDETLEKAELFLDGWKEVNEALNQYKSASEKEVREKNEALEELDLLMRDLWEGVKRRARREKQPAEVLTYYQLPLSGIVPKSVKQKDLLAMASASIIGDSKAVEAGYAAMQNPNVEEVKAALEVAQKEINDVAPADRAYDEAQEAIEEKRVEADHIISDIIDELKFNLRRKDPASQRRIIQSYGVEIVYSGNGNSNDNEPIDLE